MAGRVSCLKTIRVREGKVDEVPPRIQDQAEVLGAC